MGFIFSEMEPVEVTMTLTPQEDDKVFFRATWEAKGKIFFFFDTTFASYDKAETHSPVYFMRPHQFVDEVGIKLDTPLGQVYLCPLTDRKHVRVRDTEGNEFDWPFDYKVGSVFLLTFKENQVVSS